MAPGVRLMTPRGQMSGANNKPAMAEMPMPIKAMFASRSALENPHPNPYSKRKRKGKRAHSSSFTGLTMFKECFESGPPPKREKTETPKEAKERRRKEAMEKNEALLSELLKSYNPNAPPYADGQLTQDAYKTIFVGRLNYDTGLTKLRREFERFGTIRNIRVVTNAEGKPKGYGFIEFETDAEMKTALRAMNGRMLDGKRIVVDVERGRTVKNWKPRRLGGGDGGESRKAKPKKSELPPAGARQGEAPHGANGGYGSLARGPPPRGGSGMGVRERGPPRNHGTARGNFDDRGRGGIGYGGRDGDRDYDRGRESDRSKFRYGSGSRYGPPGGSSYGVSAGDRYGERDRYGGGGGRYGNTNGRRRSRSRERRRY